MKVVRMDRVSKEGVVNPIFTGREVTRQVLLPESKEYDVNIINFGKGVRNKFHAHEHEQVLIVTAGKGVVATEKEEKIVTVGDMVHSLPAKSTGMVPRGTRSFPTSSW